MLFLFIDLPNPMMMAEHASFGALNPKEIVCYLMANVLQG